MGYDEHWGNHGKGFKPGDKVVKMAGSLAGEVVREGKPLRGMTRYVVRDDITGHCGLVRGNSLRLMHCEHVKDRMLEETLRPGGETHDDRCCMNGIPPGKDPHPDCPGVEVLQRQYLSLKQAMAGPNPPIVIYDESASSWVHLGPGKTNLIEVVKLLRTRVKIRVGGVLVANVWPDLLWVTEAADGRSLEENGPRPWQPGDPVGEPPGHGYWETGDDPGSDG